MTSNNIVFDASCCTFDGQVIVNSAAGLVIEDSALSAKTTTIYQSSDNFVISFSSGSGALEILNSTNRTFELLKLIAIRSRVSIKSIEEITSSWERNNSSANTIFQQIANGSLRSVELLNMIVLKSNPNREALEVIMRRYRENNASATNVNHQQCNGQYRIAELCSIWAISSVPWVR
jgi:hypothetical protein